MRRMKPHELAKVIADLQSQVAVLSGRVEALEAKPAKKAEPKAKA